jgi:site-specific DNA recombinase
MANLEETTEKRRVAIYIRVSTQEQKVDGYGLEAQETRLTDYTEKRETEGWEMKKTWIYTDVHTGSDLNREGLDRLREDVRAGKFDAVLVWKIDRLSRNLKHLLTLFDEFQKNDVSFISIQENIDFKGPIGNLIFQIFGAIAQFERELIKGRTMMGKITSAEQGNWTGTNIPYGYKKVKNPSGKGSKLQIISEEKKWVQQIFDWYIYDELGDGQIAKKLNELKVPKTNHKRTSRASAQWTNAMVKTILTLTVYRGQHIANRKDEAGMLLPEEQWTITIVPPCVSEFTFLQAEEARKRRVSKTSGTEYLLTGKLVDMDLEKPKKFVGAKRNKGGFSYRRRQFDKKDKHFSVFEIPGKQMEEFVWEKIMDALKKPEVFIKHYLSREYADGSRIEKLEQQLGTLREKKMNNDLAIARIENAYEEGQYSKEKMEEKLMERNKENTQIDEQIQDIEDQLRLISSVDVEVEKLKEASKQVKYRLQNLNRREKKILCQLFVDRVEMRRRKVHGRWKVSGDVFFRFNPQKFSEEVGEDRTSKTLVGATSGSSKRGNLDSGGPGWLFSELSNLYARIKSLDLSLLALA